MPVIRAKGKQTVTFYLISRFMIDPLMSLLINQVARLLFQPAAVISFLKTADRKKVQRQFRTVTGAMPCTRKPARIGTVHHLCILIFLDLIFLIYFSVTVIIAYNLCARCVTSLNCNFVTISHVDLYSI